MNTNMYGVSFFFEGLRELFRPWHGDNTYFDNNVLFVAKKVLIVSTQPANESDVIHLNV